MRGGSGRRRGRKHPRRNGASAHAPPALTIQTTALTVNSGGTFSFPFNVPDMAPGQFTVRAHGRNSDLASTATFTISLPGLSLAFSVPQAAPGTSLTIMAAGFQPGEDVAVSFNGPQVGLAQKAKRQRRTSYR